MIAIIRYNEIALKGRNRAWFEDKLILNIKKSFSNSEIKVKKKYGRVLVVFSKDQIDDIKKTLSRTFGIESFSFGILSKSNFDNITKNVVDLVKHNPNQWNTFRVTTKRQDKQFPIKSNTLNEKIGGCILDTFTQKKVDLTNFDLNIRIEVTHHETYITTEHHKGPGGLPVGVSGKYVCMLSGGIDSPVAAWHMAKRGCDVHFIHFHSLPYTDRASTQKVNELAEILSTWGLNTKVSQTPFAETQKEIVKKTNSSYRIILYRRHMMRLAEVYARKIGAQAIITGESLGQVASQTIENITVIEDAVSIPILRPLIGFDKNEIIEIAKKIGTFETSILPHEDCCSLFMPKNPIIRSTLNEVKKEEENLDLKI